MKSVSLSTDGKQLFKKNEEDFDIFRLPRSLCISSSVHSVSWTFEKIKINYKFQTEWREKKRMSEMFRATDGTKREYT